MHSQIRDQYIINKNKTFKIHKIGKVIKMIKAVKVSKYLQNIECEWMENAENIYYKRTLTL